LQLTDADYFLKAVKPVGKAHNQITKNLLN